MPAMLCTAVSHRRRPRTNASALARDRSGIDDVHRIELCTEAHER